MNNKINKHFTVILLTAIISCSVFANNSSVLAKQEYKKGFTYSKLTKKVKKRITGKSYRKNGYIGTSDLRYVSILYYNYNGKTRKGEMIVNKKIAQDVVEIFYELYQIRYPVHRIKLVDEYGADDNNSMEADNTSCFNFRPIAGSKKNLSVHALGLAIDINPRVNPCVGGVHGLLPYNSKLYKQRNVSKCKGKYGKMMIHKNDEVYNIFKKHGFLWGGDWHAMKDYQHFYKVTSNSDMKLKYEW